MQTFLKFPDEQTAQQVLAQWYVDRDITETRETGETAIDYIYEMIDADGDVERHHADHELTDEEMADCISDPADGFVSMRFIAAEEYQVTETIVTGRESYWSTSSHTHALDIIGTINRPTGAKLQTEFGEVDEMAPIDGWHCNLVGELPEAAVPYIVTPAAPVRVFL